MTFEDLQRPRVHFKQPPAARQKPTDILLLLFLYRHAFFFPAFAQGRNVPAEWDVRLNELPPPAREGVSQGVSGYYLFASRN